MSSIQITETGRGARRRPTVTPREVAAADGKVWIPWAVVAGVRVEHAWTGSHVVLEFDEGVPAVGDAYRRTEAPLWEARRSLRRPVLATAMVIAIAVALAACGGQERPVPAGADATATPVVTPPAATATALLDSWQNPVLATRHRDRAPFTSYARDARAAATQIHDDELARAVRRSGESWTSWADAVKERRDRAQVAELFVRAVEDYDAAYRTADSEPPAALSLH